MKRIGKQYNIQTVFSSKDTLRSHLTKTKPRGQKDMKNCVYRIPCEFGQSYVGENLRPLETKTKEHQNHPLTKETNRSGAADHDWTHGRQLQWSEAEIVLREENWQKSPTSKFIMRVREKHKL